MTRKVQNMEYENLKTKYILVAGKDENDLKKLLEDLKEYIVEKDSNSETDIKHSFNGFKTYISIKDGYTSLLNDYWKQNKIHVECVSSRNNIIDGNSKKITEDNLQKKGCTRWGIIIDTNYEERKQMRNLKEVRK